MKQTECIEKYLLYPPASPPTLHLQVDIKITNILHSTGWSNGKKVNFVLFCFISEFLRDKLENCSRFIKL